MSASELMVFETLSQSAIDAASWLDHWLVTVATKMGEGISSEMKELLLSGGRTVRFICTQSAYLWTAALLKRRDAVLSGAKVSPEEKLALRNSGFLADPDLFPTELVQSLAEARETKQATSFMGDVAKLAASAQKSAKRPAPAPSTSSAPKRKKKVFPPSTKSKGAPQGGQKQRPPAAKKGKSFRGQGSGNGPKGKGKGSGGQ